MTSPPAEDVAAARPAEGRWRGTVMAERQAVRRRALLDAGLELIGTVGWPGTTVRGVCRTAGLNPRYFYESFADLDELLVAVYDQVVVEATAALAAVAERAVPDLRLLVRDTVTAGFRFLSEDPRRARVLFVEAAGHPTLGRRRFDTLLAMADRVQEMGQRLRPPGDAPVPDGPTADRLATVAANLLVGGVMELCVAWLDGRLDIPLEELADDVSVLAVGAAEAAARPARPGRAGPP